MSIGIGACANLILQDENKVIYEYGGYNLSEEQFRNTEQVYDGTTITIQKDCFVKPEIHEKLKKMSDGLLLDTKGEIRVCIM